MEESQPFDLSGGSSNTIAIASAASLFAALLLTVP
jgi:energy-coupling factor transporter ATP-binding protein EcfA2